MVPNYSPEDQNLIPPLIPEERGCQSPRPRSSFSRAAFRGSAAAYSAMYCCALDHTSIARRGTEGHTRRNVRERENKCHSVAVRPKVLQEAEAQLQLMPDDPPLRIRPEM